MSKERELLARVLESRTFMQGVALRREIEQLLAQPELSTDSLQLDEQDLREDLRECLRDRFAGLAMQRLLVGYSAPAYKDAAKLSYQMADAMLIAREAGL